MANAKFRFTPATQVASCTGMYAIEYDTDELVQSVEFITFDGYETHRTFTVLLNTKTGSDFPYQYVTYYNHPANKETYGKTRYQMWTLELYFDEQRYTNLEGEYDQTANSNASSITNIQVYAPDGELLPKDIFNRWIVSNTYPAGTQFKITCNSSYPLSSSSWINVNDAMFTQTRSFIEMSYAQNKNTAVFEINDVIPSGGVDYIQFDYDDNYGIGVSITYIPLTRDNIQPARIIPERDNFSDITWQQSEASASVELVNISQSDITVSADKPWITADLDTSNILHIHIEQNDSESQRSGVITLEGTNSEGIYASAIIKITQAVKDLPYIGNAVETGEYYGHVLPIIHTDYKGNVINNTDKFTVFNVLSSTGEDILDGFWVYGIDEYEVLTDKFELNYIPGTRNAELVVTGKFDYNYYTTDYSKQLTVCLNTNNGYGIIEQNIMLVSNASPEHIVSPIWKDVFYNCNKRYFRFRNIETNELLYNGVIYPNASNKIKVNEILSDYIVINKYPFDNENGYVLNNMLVEAILEISDDYTFGYYDEAAIYHLYWNYSYDYNQPDNLMAGFTPGYYGVHSGIDMDDNFYNPIQYYDPRQLLFVNDAQGFTGYNNSNIQVYGLTSEYEKTKIASIDKNTIKGDKFTFVIRPQDYSEIMYHIDAAPGEDYDHDYTWYCGKSKCTNADYAVYYLNSSGFWCWMLFEGKQIENLKTNINKFITDNSNNISYNIHNGVYSNTIEETYNLTSVYLKDEQSKMLKDLYTSPLIYVHELDNNLIYNVYLGTNTYDIKTYRNQGKKRYTHTIKLIKSINKNISI